MKLPMVPPSPPGWGDDKLTEFLTHAQGNQYATFDNKREAVADLVSLDAMFVRFLDGSLNPRPLHPMQFLLRAHAAFRASVGLVMSGQIYEAQATLRLCLEHASYGFYIGNDDGRWRRWMSRHDSEADRKAVRNDFSAAKIQAHLNDAAPKIGVIYSRLYESLIDFGAHPNERGFSMNTAMERGEDRVHFNTIYLHKDGTALDFGLKTCARIGLCVLMIARLIYAEKLKLLGIHDQIDAMKTRY